MSYQATSWAWEVFPSFPSMRPTRRLVLLALAECHNKATNRCDPSIDQLVRMTSLKRDTIIDGIKNLEAIGLIFCQRILGAKTSYGLALTSPESGMGTSPEMDTSPKNGTGTKKGTPPVPKTGLDQSRKWDSHLNQEVPGNNQEPKELLYKRGREDNKQPEGASSGGRGRHKGEPSQRVRRRTVERVPMTVDWQPAESLWADIDDLGIDRDFVKGLVPEFRLYWLKDRPHEERPGWDRTFLAHAKTNWQRDGCRPKSGTNLAQIGPGASKPRANGDFRTFGEMRAQRNIEIALEFANETSERVING